MKITITSKKIELTDAIKEYVEKKILSLEKFLSRFFKYSDNPIEQRKERVEIFVEIGRESGGTKISSFYSKAQIDISGKKVLIVKSQSGKLNEAIDQMKDELQRNIIDYKDKPASLKERNVKKIKKDLNLSKDARLNRKGRLREEGL